MLTFAAARAGYGEMMDIDHEAHKHKVPKSKVAGEADRAEAEDPGEQIHGALDDAKKVVDPEGKHSDSGSDSDGGDAQAT